MFRSPLTDAIVVLIIVLLFVGPKKLPALGKGLGHGMREFKEGITGESKADETPAIDQGTATPGPAPTTGPAPQPVHASQPGAGSAPADTQRS